MKSRTLPLMLAALLPVSAVQAGYRSWTNTEGVKIEAEFVKAEGANVTLRLRNGRTTTFSQDKLSAADVEFIKAAPAEEAKPAATTSVPANRKAKWLEKLKAAEMDAQETGLPILLLFTGSKWCGYCIKLEENILSKKEFKEFANQHLVLLKYDFEGPSDPPSRDASEQAKKFNVSGFPSYFLITADGKVLSDRKGADESSPDGFAKWVEKNVKK